VPATVTPIHFHALPALQLATASGATAIVTHHGAHVVSWCPRPGDERLYLSPKSAFADGQAIRGGIPLIFPQFGPDGPLPRHGFARNGAWEVAATRTGDDWALATLRLTDGPGTRARWDHAFVAELTVLIEGDRLEIELGIENPGDTPLAFTGALHTYLATKQVELVRLEGLRGTSYRDQTAAQIVREERADAVTVADEVDRIYLDAPPRLTLGEGGRWLAVEQSGFRDTVVWNPWETRGAAIADLPADGFRRMLCVEAAAVAEPVVVAPGESWAGRQGLVAG
jgi:glucose-6-phosphate 1-epimerase